MPATSRLKSSSSPLCCPTHQSNTPVAKCSHARQSAARLLERSDRFQCRFRQLDQGETFRDIHLGGGYDRRNSSWQTPASSTCYGYHPLCSLPSMTARCTLPCSPGITFCA